MNDNQPYSGDFTLSKLPPNGHEDVGLFFYDLFQTGEAEKARLGLPERWLNNYRLFRGAHWPQEAHTSKKKRDRIVANLVYANIHRTVANLTAKQPKAEAVETGFEEIEDAQEEQLRQMQTQREQDAKLLSAYLDEWWNESEQASALVDSVQNMETYAPTVEKYTWNSRMRRMDTVVVDPFAFGIAPGVFEDIGLDAPYVYHAYAMRADEVEEMFGLEDGEVEADDVYSILGEEREDSRPVSAGTRPGSTNLPGNYADTRHPTPSGTDYREKRALVVEIWVRDYSKEVAQEIDGESGEVVEIERPAYPGGIRVVTITNRGHLVLNDTGNPNINSEISTSEAAKTWLYERFPFSMAVSCRDTTSQWGFSNAEQTGDINLKVNELMTRVGAYLNRVMLPPLIIPKPCGINLSHVTNKPGLVLQPQTLQHGIQYMTPPHLPNDFYKMLQLYLDFFDRVWHIEDADRGEKPGQVTAASAIAALQERNAVLIRHKIRAVDYLIRQRGRAAISFFQNFGVTAEVVKVDDEEQPIKGIDLIGRQFAFVVETGSTVHRTTLQTQEQAMKLAEMNRIDTRALLETLDFPKWREVVERAGENELDLALNILVQAGLPQEQAQQLRMLLAQAQGGPGDDQPQGAQPGVPVAQQGRV